MGFAKYRFRHLELIFFASGIEQNLSETASLSLSASLLFPIPLHPVRPQVRLGYPLRPIQ